MIFLKIYMDGFLYIYKVSIYFFSLKKMLKVEKQNIEEKLQSEPKIADSNLSTFFSAIRGKMLTSKIRYFW